jgi:hypothetical protein
MSNTEMKQLEPGLAKAVEADQAFFERHPERHYRLRHSHSAEVRWREIEAGQSWPLPPQTEWFTVVHHLGNGYLMQALTTNVAGAETDLPDRVCEFMFRVETENRELPIEQRLLRVMERMS